MLVFGPSFNYPTFISAALIRDQPTHLALQTLLLRFIIVINTIAIIVNCLAFKFLGIYGWMVHTYNFVFIHFSHLRNDPQYRTPPKDFILDHFFGELYKDGGGWKSDVSAN